MQDSVAQGVGFGVNKVGLVVQAEEPGPGVQIGGDVRGEDPALERYSEWAYPHVR